MRRTEMSIFPQETPIFLSAFTPRIFIFSINAFRAEMETVCNSLHQNRQCNDQYAVLGWQRELAAISFSRENRSKMRESEVRLWLTALQNAGVRRGGASRRRPTVRH